MKCILAFRMALFSGAFVSFFLCGQGSSAEFSCGNCSHYFFHSFKKTDKPKTWLKAMDLCKNNGTELVSMESDEEWELIINLTKIQNVATVTDWYIGLKKIKDTNQWCWLSDNKTCVRIGENDKGKWRFQTGLPSGDGHCADMTTYINNKNDYGRYNDVNCETIFGGRGYICEKEIDCSKLESSEHTFQSIKHIDFTELATPLSTFSTAITMTSKPESPNVHTTVRSSVNDPKTCASTSDHSTSIALAASLSALIFLIIFIR